MGKVSKGVKCSVAGCGEKAVKSISIQRIPSGMKIEGSGRRAISARLTGNCSRS